MKDDVSKGFESILSQSETFRYMLLDRMKTDCEYFLGNGHGSEKFLWTGNAKEQIADMKALWNSFAADRKPETISMSDIERYEIKMDTAKKLQDINHLLTPVKDIHINEKGNLMYRSVDVLYDFDPKTDVVSCKHMSEDAWININLSGTVKEAFHAIVNILQDKDLRIEKLNENASKLNEIKALGNKSDKDVSKDAKQREER